MDNHSDAKERLMNTVVGLLLENKDVSRITNRQIAEMADVNSAMINYYYQSRENLLNMAVTHCMESTAGKLFEVTDKNDSPSQRIRTMIKAISTFSFGNYSLSTLSIAADIKAGSIYTSSLILPLLKEIFPNKSEAELKVTALQIVVPMQIIFLNAENYKKYLSADIYDEAGRNKLLDSMIDNILKGGF